MTGSSLTLPEPTPRFPAPGAVRSLLATIRIIHPFPTLLNVAATAGLAFVAARGAPGASTLVRMLLLMLCAQSAIGVTNDYFDRDLDAQTKPWKPVAAGLVTPAHARILALVLIVVTIGLAATLGLAGFALALVGLAAGLVYDARLKRTLFSAIPYMVAIPTLPLWVWLTLGQRDPVLWWLLPVGALLGLALHLANTLPDIDSDRSQAVIGLAHRLGPQRSMFVGWASFALALAVTLAIAPLVRYDVHTYLPAATAAAGLLAASVGMYALRRDSFALEFGFGALGLGSAILAVGWLAAAT